MVALFIFGETLSQNYPLYNNYITNPFLINPAEAATDHINVFANYRIQWAGMSGAPKIGTIGASTLLNEKRVGLGFKGSSFKRGFLNSSDVSLTYAYGVPINKQNKLFFGLSGGILSNSVDWKMVTDNTDPTLANLKGGIMPSMSFGVLLKNESGINVGLVLPQMLRAESFDNNYGIAAQDNAMLMVYYSNWKEQIKVSSHNKSKKVHKSSKNKGSPLEVFTILRYSDVGIQAEGSVKYNFQSHLWLSATFRRPSGLIPGLGFKVSNFSLGYFYESGLGSDIPLKSHEISLNLRLGKEKIFRGEGKPPEKPATTPRPRFGTPDPKMSSKPEPKAPPVAKGTKGSKQAEPKKQPVTEVKKEPVVVTPEVKKEPVVITPEVKKEQVVVTPEVKKEPVVVTPEVKKEPVVVTPEVKKEPVVVTPEVKKEPVVVTPEVKKEPVVVTPEVKKEPVVVKTEPVVAPPLPTFTNEAEKAQHDDELDKISRLSDHKENPTEEHNEDGHPHAERHEFARRGTHQDEMELGDYVIVGVFRGEANAKHMSEELKKLGFSEADYGFLTEKAVWYVHFEPTDDIEEAKTKRNKYRKMKMFKDAWLLTVHQ
jgi:type IX secretion system PorP/SprF family membrane protein